ncbi:hypothetical protein H0E87_023118 [Populus deltoides]|uniref:Disease resistance protein At4g27190-like leucine-rich repeats domain-containing protein n=1 Tax=Populus deltoides TaxID=3696 RepID=A0A8T2XCW3_POPDE|nr:hypothetical protein H0E87_023118 [Populus deltoides]
MEKLLVTHGYFKELFPCRLVDEEEHTLARILHLKLFNLPDLEKIWNQDLQVDQLLQNLETLEVRSCDSLINLAPSASSFGNLTALHVWDCEALKYLVTSSTARSLVQLSAMSIKECKMVTEIVASKGDEAGNEIIFWKLESLKLDCLASLTSFCSINFTFKFPSLTEVIVTNCPKMKTFSPGISTPKLQKIRLVLQGSAIVTHYLRALSYQDSSAYFLSDDQARQGGNEKKNRVTQEVSPGKFPWGGQRSSKPVMFNQTPWPAQSLEVEEEWKLGCGRHLAGMSAGQLPVTHSIWTPGCDLPGRHALFCNLQGHS